jgi:hypothetical protein
MKENKYLEELTVASTPLSLTVIDNMKNRTKPDGDKQINS